MSDKIIDNLEAKHHRLMQEGRTYEASQVEAEVMALLNSQEKSYQ